MKLALCFLVVFVVVSVSTAAKYSSIYEKTSPEEVLKNDRLTRQYIDCCVEKKPCTKDGLDLKRDIEMALKTGCSDCNEKQKSGLRKTINYLKDNKPDWWKELMEFFNPDGKHDKKLNDFLNEH